MVFRCVNPNIYLDFSKLWVDCLSDLDWFSMDAGDVRDRLLDLRGVGPWTVDMVMIFALGQPDILPLGDIGLIRAIERTYADGSNLEAKEILDINWLVPLQNSGDMVSLEGC